VKEIFETYVDNAFGEYKQAEFKFEQFENNYKKFFPADKDSFVLDVGIGRGEMLSCMKNWGYRNYLGVDISPSTVSFCRSIQLNCMQINETSEWLQGYPNHFDLITLLDVLEHVNKENTIHFLRAIHSSLKSTGVVIIQVPNLQAPDGQLHRYNDFTHEVGYVEHTLSQVLMCSGFTNINFYGFETLIARSYTSYKQLLLRRIYWKFIRKIREITENLNPNILHPVMFAVATK